jgi:type VI secretion system protein ImpF
MAEIAPRDRLLPSLLDRLTDNDPGATVEAREFKVLSLRQLRQNVLRDLTWLMNTTCLEANEDLGKWPAVRKSVLNFGMPALSGNYASGIDPRAMQQKIREAIIAYEPRLLANSVKVLAVVDDNAGASRNVLSFKIQAQLWAQPAPIELMMRTDIDLETGQTKIEEVTR